MEPITDALDIFFCNPKFSAKTGRNTENARRADERNIRLRKEATTTTHPYPPSGGFSAEGAG
jgi:acid phosphatase class B